MNYKCGLMLSSDGRRILWDIFVGATPTVSSCSKVRTSPAQPKDRENPDPPWPYEWMILLAEPSLFKRISRSTRTFSDRVGRLPCTNGASGSYSAFSSPGTK